MAFSTLRKGFKMYDFAKIKVFFGGFFFLTIFAINVKLIILNEYIFFATDGHKWSTTVEQRINWGISPFLFLADRLGTFTPF